MGPSWLVISEGTAFFHWPLAADLYPLGCGSLVDAVQSAHSDAVANQVHLPTS